jgi:sulfotransferase
VTQAVKAVYDFIGEKLFGHDFNNVVFDADEFDTRLGTPRLASRRPASQIRGTRNDFAAGHLSPL